MKYLSKLSILLIIAIMVCGLFLLAGEVHTAQAANGLQETKTALASVAWLEVF